MHMRSTLLMALLTSLGLFLCSCSSRDATEVDEDAEAAGLWRDLAAAKTSAGMHDLVAQEIVRFAFDEQVLVDRRTAFANAVLIAQADTADGQALSGADIERLNRTFAEVLASVRTLVPLAARHAEWRQVDAQSCAKHGVPAASADLRLQGIALSGAASLALYDTFLLNCNLVLGQEPIRHALNQGDAGLDLPGDQVDAVMRSYLSYGRRTRVHLCLRELARAGDAWTTSTDAHSVFLRARIAESQSGHLLTVTRRIPLPQAAPAGFTLLSSDLRALGDNVVGGTSKGFGNAVGLVALRHGKLYGDATIEAGIHTRLKPGDILVEKTPFRLTDKFIPGHYGHVAIWVGGETELRALGLWDEPLVQKNAAALSAGHGVVEALRDGVQLSPLAHFLNIDDLGVLRQNDLSDDERREVIRRSLRQLGKEYDFNFDVETADRIVCSELVYQVYTKLKWPIDRTAGRWTISPDQVAKCCLPMGPLTLVDLWCDGKQVTMDPIATMAVLLDQSAASK
jgi:Permuted papain-like amidase enzyme, YaeF/YiiX, C92 family